MRNCKLTVVVHKKMTERKAIDEHGAEILEFHAYWAYLGPRLIVISNEVEIL